MHQKCLKKLYVGHFFVCNIFITLRSISKITKTTIQRHFSEIWHHFYANDAILDSPKSVVFSKTSENFTKPTLGNFVFDFLTLFLSKINI